MNIVETANQIAKKYKEALIKSKEVVSDNVLHEISKSHPFYGYIDIKIGEIKPFVMFSNNDDLVARSYFWRGADAYEPMSLKLWVALAKTSPVVIDIGSYTGVYSLAAAHANPKIKIFSFEALDRVYSRLLINRHVNQMGNFHTFNYAVSNVEGETEFNIYSGESILVTGSSLIEKSINRDIFEKKKVRTIVLDRFFSDIQLVDIKLVKIDAEGAEHFVLQGGAQIIKRDSPDILIELLKDADVGAITEILSCHPYKFYQIDDVAKTITSSPTLKVATGMHNLNTLISCKSESEIQSILSGIL